MPRYIKPLERRLRKLTLWAVAMAVAAALAIAIYAQIRYRIGVRANHAIALIQRPELVGAAEAGEPLRIGIIGDSISCNGNPSPAKVFAETVSTDLGRPVLLVNRALPGTSTVHWVPDGPYFGDAKCAFQENHVSHVLVMLGTNDTLRTLAVDSEDYADNMRTICRGLTDAGFVVVLNVCRPTSRPKAIRGGCRRTAAGWRT